MSVLGEAGRTRLSIPAIAGPERPVDPFLEAVREVAGTDFTVFGEIGRATDGSISYLARDGRRDCLVALKLGRRADAPDEFELEVVQELRDDLPAFDKFCAKCGSALRPWGRFCPQCGGEVFGDVGPWSPEELRQAVSDFAGDRYDILGEMRSQGGRIYFAREKSSGKIEALRLEKKGADEFALGLTGVLKPIVQGTTPGAGPWPGAPPPAAPPAGDRARPAPPPGLTAPSAPVRPPEPSRGPATSRLAGPRMVDEWLRLGRRLWAEILERPPAIVAVVVAGMLLLVLILALLT
jgi:hypothetical protein